jgi:hypothetical protein
MKQRPARLHEKAMRVAVDFQRDLKRLSRFYDSRRGLFFHYRIARSRNGNSPDSQGSEELPARHSPPTLIIAASAFFCISIFAHSMLLEIRLFSDLRV